MKHLVVASIGGAALLAGCLLFTGSTDGYTTSTPFACRLPTDCPQGQVCCYGLVDQMPGSQCQASCSQPYEQACASAQDCGDGGVCLIQSCSIDGGLTTQVATCGAIPQICAQ
jgi:hypothetical protein